MRRRSARRITLRPTVMLAATMVVFLPSTLLVGCGGGGGNGDGSSGKPSTQTPTPTPTASAPPATPPIASVPFVSNRSYRVVVPLSDGREFVATLKTSEPNTISGRATLTINPSEQDNAEIAGSVIFANNKLAMLIEGDSVFRRESILDSSGLGSHEETTHKIRLFGFLTDVLGQEVEASLVIDGTEYKGIIVLVEEVTPVPPVTPAPPVIPVSPVTPTPPVPSVDPTGSYNLSTGVIEGYDVPGTSIDIRNDGTYTVFVPEAREDGEIVGGKKEMLGAWRKDGTNFVFDLKLTKDDGDLNGVFDAEESVEDNDPDNYRFTIERKENGITLSDEEELIELTLKPLS